MLYPCQPIKSRCRPLEPVDVDVLDLLHLITQDAQVPQDRLLSLDIATKGCLGMGFGYVEGMFPVDSDASHHHALMKCTPIH